MKKTILLSLLISGSAFAQAYVPIVYKKLNQPHRGDRVSCRVETSKSLAEIKAAAQSLNGGMTCATQMVYSAQESAKALLFCRASGAAAPYGAGTYVSEISLSCSGVEDVQNVDATDLKEINSWADEVIGNP